MTVFSRISGVNCNIIPCINVELITIFAYFHKVVFKGKITFIYFI